MTNIVNNNADFLLEKEAKKENNMLKNESCFGWKSVFVERSIADNAKVSETGFAVFRRP